ncbi:MAG TPA: hypothetical protein VFV52_01800 [Bacilli bacterium]|nr:hypothetical protein [Bacilli bacterium]
MTWGGTSFYAAFLSGRSFSEVALEFLGQLVFPLLPIVVFGVWNALRERERRQKGGAEAEVRLNTMYLLLVLGVLFFFIGIGPVVNPLISAVVLSVSQSSKPLEEFLIRQVGNAVMQGTFPLFLSWLFFWRYQVRLRREGQGRQKAVYLRVFRVIAFLYALTPIFSALGVFFLTWKGTVPGNLDGKELLLTQVLIVAMYPILYGLVVWRERWKERSA